jgi:hypothetical protein
MNYVQLFGVVACGILAFFFLSIANDAFVFRQWGIKNAWRAAAPYLIAEGALFVLVLLYTAYIWRMD